MTRTISSSLTFVYKFIFPISWIGFFGFGTIVMLFTGAEESWLFLGVWIFASLLLGAFCFPLKRVQIDGDHLLVSNFFRTVRIPLADIHRVTESAIINIHPVWIHFRKPTEFGAKIMFMPTARMFAFFSSHPIVGELEELSKQ